MMRGFIAASVDGFVADQRGDVAWLEPFNDVDYGYDAFVAEIEAVVLGRKTYEQILSFGNEWPYPGKKGFVVTSSALDIPFAGVRTWSHGLAALAAELQKQNLDSWAVGGPTLQTALIEEGLLDRLELFVIPVLLGKGVPLFRSDKGFRHLRLNETQTFEKDLVKLDYRMAA